MTTEKTVTRDGVEFRFQMQDLHVSISGQIQLTTVLNAGKSTEQTLPANYVNIPQSAHVNLGDEEGIKNFVKENPEFERLIKFYLDRVTKDYEAPKA